MATLQIGESFARDITFDADGIRAFASLAGDQNPLHHDADYASRSKFGGLIASGTQYGALLMGMVATHLTRDAMALGVEFGFRFRKAVHAGQTLRLAWTITAIEPRPTLGGDFVHLSGRVTDADGTTYVTATATCLVLPPMADATTTG